ncbi:amino acid adenylation domain-containing protein [Plantactinospora sp. WMMB334]|uniref:amino acid adenylation domain-containing protein n=1 Tax=Plantactinospora sp. WMMB334 TaxID=3404119 RepID=UPI003B9233BA
MTQQEFAVVRGGPPAPEDLPAIHVLIGAQARDRPRTPALRDSEGILDYGDLDRRSDALAARLALPPEARVGIWMRRGRAAVVASLAVLKAGGTYVPLDPTYPPERIRFMVADAGCVLVLTDGTIPAPVPAQVPVVDLTRPAPPATAVAARRAHPDQAAVVLYTSGSTGQPKGAVLTHANVVALAGGHPALRHSPGDLVAHVLSSAFDAVLLDVWGALIQGASVYLCSDGVLRSVGHLIEEIERIPVTTLPLTSSLLHQLAAVAPDWIERFDQVWFGGEAADASVVSRLLAAGTRLVHHYGPTECTSISTVYVVESPPTGAAPIPIGRGLATVDLHVLDAELRPVRPGETGELFVGGPQVGRGYLGRARLTAERFVPDPYTGVPGRRLFRTGDLVRQLAGGELRFVGRVDDQVKIRGYRVEPAEVSATLRTVPGVRDAVTIAVPDGSGGRRLVAYVAGPPEIEAPLREAAALALPEYLRPAQYVLLDALPLLPNKKVDRAALPPPPLPGQGAGPVGAVDPDDAAPVGAHEPEDPAAAGAVDPDGPAAAGGARPDGPAPDGGVQARLARLWCELLGVPAVRAGDDFFGLGGYSLLAARMMNRVQQDFGVRVPLRVLFEARTLGELASVVANAVGAEAPRPPVPAARRPSPEQRELWFVDRLDPGGSDYNSPIAFRVGGRLDLDALRRSVDEIVARHEVLRWTFRSTGRDVEVVATPPAPVPLPVDDLRPGRPGATDGDPAASIARWLDEHRRTPFDLASGPLLRVRALRLADEDVVVLVTVHHIVFDGWSFAVFVDELGRLYDAYAGGRPSPLPALPGQYGDLVAADHARMDSGALDDQLAYWRAALDGAPSVVELPDGVPGAPGPAVSAVGRTSVEVAAAVRDQAARRHGTPFMVLLGALGLVLRALSGADDMVVACPNLRRPGPHADNLVGMFVQMLPIRLALGGRQRLAEVFGTVQESAVGALRNQDVPFERIIQRLRPARSGRTRAPYSQVVFNMVSLRMPVPRLGGLPVELLRVDTPEARVPLAVIVSEPEDRYEFTVLADPRRVAPEVAELVAGRLPVAAALVASQEQLTVDQAVRRLR